MAWFIVNPNTNNVQRPRTMWLPLQLVSIPPGQGVISCSQLIEPSDEYHSLNDDGKVARRGMVRGKLWIRACMALQHALSDHNLRDVTAT